MAAVCRALIVQELRTPLDFLRGQRRYVDREIASHTLKPRFTPGRSLSSSNQRLKYGAERTVVCRKGYPVPK